MRSAQSLVPVLRLLLVRRFASRLRCAPRVSSFSASRLSLLVAPLCFSLLAAASACPPLAPCFSSRLSRLALPRGASPLLLAARSGLPPVGGRPGCRRLVRGQRAAAVARRGRLWRGRWGRPPPGRPEVPPPPERSGPSTEPPEEPDEAVSPRIPLDDVVGASSVGARALRKPTSVAGGGGGQRRRRRSRPPARFREAVPEGCPEADLRAGSSGASASSVMTALSATVQRACVPRRLPTVVPSAELPSDLNGSPRLRRLEPLKRSGFPCKAAAFAGACASELTLRRPVPPVVVEQDVDLVRVLPELLERLDPLLELLVGVEVVEAVAGAAAAGVPGAGVAAVEADVGERAGGRDDRGDEVLRLRLGRVDDDVARRRAPPGGRASSRDSPRPASSGGGTRPGGDRRRAARRPSAGSRMTDPC